MLQLRDPRDLGRIHELTVEEYLGSNIDGHTELLGGIVYDVSPKNTPHGLAIRRLIKAFRLLSDEYSLSVQDPIAVAGWKGKHAPEIDVAVIAEKPYEKMPTAADSFAFIEVSDTTYQSDRGYKIPLYVAAGVPSWIVNIPERWVEFYGSPDDLALEHGHVLRGSFEVLGVTIEIANLLDP
jgi:hypothetical protein